MRRSYSAAWDFFTVAVAPRHWKTPGRHPQVAAHQSCRYWFMVTGFCTKSRSGLANGTPHTFEVRAVRSGKVGATATASATPLAAVCSTLDLGDRREVWSATMTVGRDIKTHQVAQTRRGLPQG